VRVLLKTGGAAVVRVRFEGVPLASTHPGKPQGAGGGVGRDGKLKAAAGAVEVLM